MRGAAGLAAILPALAVAVAVLVDRDPDGMPRVSAFPLGLMAFDPFAWTCLRNSLIFAAAVTGVSMILGLGLGVALSAGPGRARGLWRVAVGSMLALPPACLALGFVGIREWPLAAIPGRSSLETWEGWPTWLLWIWATCPAAVALVALASARAIDRIEPSWRDAARLAGAGPFGMWRDVTWPMVRPALARAAAIVFPLALFEPGVPLILGARRTLAFQIVEAASRSGPFPRIAVWTALAASASIAGRAILRWWGGSPVLDGAETADRRGLSTSGIAMMVASILLPAAAWGLGWLPILGLIRMLAGSEDAGGSAASIVRLAMEPPVPQLLGRSLLLGIEVGAGVMLLAWLMRPDPGVRPLPTFGSRLVGRFALMPPMVQGVGVLAMLELGAMILRTSGDRTRWGGLASELAVDRNPWPILIAAVGLSVAARLLSAWRRAAGRRPSETRTGLDAALLAGASRIRARSLASRRPAGWIGGLVLAAVLSAFNLAPALFFTPWMDRRNAATALLVLADGGELDRAQAAILGLCWIAGSLVGLLAARLAPAPPPEWDADPP